MASITPGYDVTVQDPHRNTGDNSTSRAPLVLGSLDFKGLTDRVANVALSWPAVWWWAMFVPSVALAGLFFSL
ncbi:MAG: hydrogenase, partial [Planctomycetota bacterium]